MRAGWVMIGMAALSFGGCASNVDEDALQASLTVPFQALADVVSDHPVQLRLLTDLECDTDNVCEPDAEMPVAEECELLDGPWREEARGELLACAEACRVDGCEACFEMDCAAAAAEEAQLEADPEVAAACEAKWEACDIEAVSCALYAVVEGEMLDNLEACLEQDCDSVMPCVRSAMVFEEAFDPEVEADAGN